MYASFLPDVLELASDWRYILREMYAAREMLLEERGRWVSLVMFRLGRER
jgi:hypothetical protein